MAPDVVVLTVTTPGAAGPAEDVARDLRAAGHDVLVGEPGRTLGELVQSARDIRAAQRRRLAERAGGEPPQ